MTALITLILGVVGIITSISYYGGTIVAEIRAMKLELHEDRKDIGQLKDNVSDLRSRVSVLESK